MKKFTAFALALAVIILSAASCGVEKDVESTADDTSISPIGTEDDTETGSDTEETAEVKPVKSYPEYAAGIVGDGYYNNEWLDLSFTPAEGVEFASEDELAEISLEAEICEMVATDQTTYSGVTLAVTSLPYEGAAEYADNLKSIYDKAGYPFAYGEITNERLGGGEYECIPCLVELANEYYTSITAYIRTIGDLTVTILITHDSEAELEGFLDCFAEAK